MTKAILCDFSRTLIFPKDQHYTGELNVLNDTMKTQPDYRPEDYFELNKEMLDYLSQLKKKVPLYIYTTGILQYEPVFYEVLNTVFKHIFTESEIGYKKTDPRAFAKIANLIDIKTDELVFIDDNEVNLDAAAQAGVTTIKYTTAHADIEKLKSFTSEG
ncbi:HAD-IA family hydrolase [Candidatus Roizmanbacteria bacterium]|nr:HAD-IA family hydrolase [Candidatus Roizmanbacteria bacterium]